MRKNLFIVILILATLSAITWRTFSIPSQSFGKKNNIGQPIDSLNGVYVFENGPISNVSGRNVTKSGYNLGLKYQCVEFVKRYYYEYFNHEMPNSYGHAKDFYNYSVLDGELNKERNLIQFQNPSRTKPRVNDLLVFKGNKWNPYGHVAIVSQVNDDNLEIIQQNVGRFSSTRETFELELTDGYWQIDSKSIVGWLHKN